MQWVERERYISNYITQSKGYYTKGRTWQRGRKSHLIGVLQESIRYQVKSDEKCFGEGGLVTIQRGKHK